MPPFLFLARIFAGSTGTTVTVPLVDDVTPENIESFRLIFLDPIAPSTGEFTLNGNVGLSQSAAGCAAAGVTQYTWPGTPAIAATVTRLLR